ncbi:uncharacterized protein LOC129218014 [Uloborus diversus]|uniref:uncharacterized protein LOC129218014 n=1 Tax=Uloborus diversus TaxID=327109 RepID=UPI00240A012A|nr:uncharacterized protein LOC129218014 [Uloborus diversus]
MEKMKWTTEYEAYFIDLIRPHKCLWDPSDLLYLKKTHKKHLMTGIGEELCKLWPAASELFTYDNLVKKFSNLRTYFQRELKAMRKFKSGSGCDVIQPRWVHFPRLSFLQDSVTPKPSTSNLPGGAPIVMESQRSEAAAGGSSCSVSSVADPEEGELHTSFLDLGAEEHCYSQPATQNSPGPSEPAQKKRKGVDDRGEDSVSVATKYLQDLNVEITKRKQTKATDTHFANFIISSMAELETEEKKDKCRLDLMKVLMQHKHNHCD